MCLQTAARRSTVLWAPTSPVCWRRPTTQHATRPTCAVSTTSSDSATNESDSTSPISTSAASCPGSIWPPGSMLRPPGACVACYRVAVICFCILLLFLSFLTISVSPLTSTSTGRIFTRFSPFGSAMAVDERSEPLFSNFQGTLPWQPIFVFCYFVFLP